MAAQVMRLAVPEDAAGIAAVKMASWRWAYEAIVPQAVLDDLDAVDEERRWRSYLDELPAEDRLWVAGEGGEVVGFARTGPVPYPDLPEQAAEVHGLYLAPSHVATGLGRTLFGHAVADLLERGHAPVVVWHFARNDRAARFYERAGFRLDGAIRTSDFGVDEVRRRLDT
jgi:GNAT superfamily N-acetyltransferase